MKRFVFQRCGRLLLVVNVKKKHAQCKYATLYGYETVDRWAIILRHTPVWGPSESKRNEILLPREESTQNTTVTQSAAYYDASYYSIRSKQTRNISNRQRKFITGQNDSFEREESTQNTTVTHKYNAESSITGQNEREETTQNTTGTKSASCATLKLQLEEATT